MFTGCFVAVDMCASAAEAVSDGPEAFFLHDQYGFAPEQQAQFMMICSASSLLWGSLAPYVGTLLPAKLICVFFSMSTAGVMAAWAALSRFQLSRSSKYDDG